MPPRIVSVERGDTVTEILFRADDGSAYYAEAYGYSPDERARVREALLRLLAATPGITLVNR